MALLLHDVFPAELQSVADCLRSHGVSTCAEFMEYGPADVIELGNVSFPQWHALQQLVVAAMAPPCYSMAALLAAQRDVAQLRSGLGRLDDALGGGLPPCVVELVGPAGAFTAAAHRAGHRVLRGPTRDVPCRHRQVTVLHDRRCNGLLARRLRRVRPLSAPSSSPASCCAWP